MVVHVLCIHAQVRPESPNVAKALMGSDDEYLKIIGNFLSAVHNLRIIHQ